MDKGWDKMTITGMTKHLETVTGMAAADIVRTAAATANSAWHVGLHHQVLKAAMWREAQGLPPLPGRGDEVLDALVMIVLGSWGAGFPREDMAPAGALRVVVDRAEELGALRIMTDVFGEGLAEAMAMDAWEFAFLEDVPAAVLKKTGCACLGKIG